MKRKKKREGKGIMKYFNTGNEYNGDWKDDKLFKNIFPGFDEPIILL